MRLADAKSNSCVVHQFCDTGLIHLACNFCIEARGQPWPSVIEWFQSHGTIIGQLRQEASPLQSWHAYRFVTSESHKTLREKKSCECVTHVHLLWVRSKSITAGASPKIQSKIPSIHEILSFFWYSIAHCSSPKQTSFCTVPARWSKIARFVERCHEAMQDSTLSSKKQSIVYCSIHYSSNNYFMILYDDSNSSPAPKLSGNSHRNIIVPISLIVLRRLLSFFVFLLHHFEIYIVFRDLRCLCESLAKVVWKIDSIVVH